MKLSIIIVNYRSWDHLENCLNSLVTDIQGRDWELIVVDNHSDDGKLAQFIDNYSSVRFIDSMRNGGFAFACNLGVAHASGEVLLFLNPDVVAAAESISALLDIKVAHPEFAIITSGQLDARGRTRKVFDVFPDKLTWFRLVKSALRRFRPDRYPNPRQEVSGVIECDWVSGSVFMISTSDFQRLGGWREDFWMYVEDCDFCLRAHREGMRVACTGDVKITHFHGGSSRRDFETSVLTRTEAVISKHMYVHLNFRSLDRVVNHICVFLTVVPILLVYSLLDLVTLRQVEMLRTRTGVLCGVFRHYGYALANRSWHSRQVSLNR